MGAKESGKTKNTYALELHNLGFSYDVKGGKYEVFREVSIQICRNEIFCIIGPSGCGKTTLINIIAGFEVPSVGKVYEEGEKISGISHKRALVFQQDAVFPWLTVYKNIEYGLRIRKMPPETRKKTVERLIEIVRLTGFEKAYPRELSGGMRKRVDLARALASDPKILLMDEPFGSLDAITKERLQIEVTEIWEKSNMTVVFITHDLEEALFLGDRIAVMQHISTNIPFKIFDVPFGRPRNIFIKEDSNFQNMRRKLIEEFKLI